jgi:hypothetical protein
MTAAQRFFALAVVLGAITLIMNSGEFAHAGPPGTSMSWAGVNKINCNSAGHAKWASSNDGGVLSMTPITCGRNPGSNVGTSAYNELRCAARQYSADAGTSGGNIYVGAGPNFNAANYTWGAKLAVDSPEGAVLPPSVNSGVLYCVTDGSADGGLALFCQCGG